MGKEGRLRAETLFDEREVLERQVQVYRQLVGERLGLKTATEMLISAANLTSGQDGETGER